MDFYLPIAEVYVSLPFIFFLSFVVGILSGLFGVGGGFLMTPFLIFLGVPPAYAVPNEANNRAITSQCVTEHTLYRKETRWPGYYYRGDHMKLDDENWHCLTVSKRDSESGKFEFEKKPVYHIIDEKEKKQAS
jgi:hypothetical protein